MRKVLKTNWHILPFSNDVSVNVEQKDGVQPEARAEWGHMSRQQKDLGGGRSAINRRV